MIPSSGVRRFASPRNLPLATHARVVSGLADKRTHGSQAAELGSDQRGKVEAFGGEFVIGSFGPGGYTKEECEGRATSGLRSRRGRGGASG